MKLLGSIEPQVSASVASGGKQIGGVIILGCRFQVANTNANLISVILWQ